MPRWDVIFDPRIEFNRELLELLVKIEAFKLSTSKIPLLPNFRKTLNTLNIVRQIRGTTGIEGNTLEEGNIEKLITERNQLKEGNDEGSMEEIREAEEAAKPERTQEEQEVINAHNVLNFIRDIVNRNPEGIITEDLIKKLHYLNTEQCHYPGNVPGQYRQGPVHAGEYLAPEHAQVPRLMDEFIRFINSRMALEGYKPIIRAVIAHFYVVSIHPFCDGNGRVSRALEAYILYQGGYNVSSFYSLANFYYKNRSGYINQLMAARFKYDGNLNAFVKFSLNGYLQEIEQVQNEILRFIKLLTFRDLFKEYLAMRDINSRQLALLEYLTSLGQPKVTVLFDLPTMGVVEYKRATHPMIKALYEKLTTKTLLRDLKGLEELELIKVVEGYIAANIDVMDQFI
ncbi:MAG: Fic family protein [Thermacetogeniaceae bacterium]